MAPKKRNLNLDDDDEDEGGGRATSYRKNNKKQQQYQDDDDDGSEQSNIYEKPNFGKSSLFNSGGASGGASGGGSSGGVGNQWCAFNIGDKSESDVERVMIA